MADPQKAARFDSELALLQRIIYKSKNQHRRTKYFHAVCMAKRSLAKVNAGWDASLKSVKALSGEFEQAKTGKEAVQLLGKVQGTLTDAIDVANHAARGYMRCVYAAARLNSLITLGRFLPLAVVSIAVTSRLGQMAREITMELMSAVDQCAILIMRRCRILLLKENDRGKQVIALFQAINNATDFISDESRKIYLNSHKVTPAAGKSAKATESMDDDIGETVVPSPSLARTKEAPNSSLKTKPSSSASAVLPTKFKETPTSSKSSLKGTKKSSTHVSHGLSKFGAGSMTAKPSSHKDTHHQQQRKRLKLG